MAPFLSWMRKKPKQGVDFTFVESQPFTSIKILKGKYKGITYQYGKIAVSEIEIKGEALVKFDLDTIDTGKYTREQLDKSEKFVKLVGEILTEIFITSAEKEPYESHRNDDFEELDLQ